LAFLIAMGSHAWLCRTKTRLTIILKFLLVGTIVGSALIYYTLTLWKGNREILASVADYAFLCELYIFLFTFVNSSVSAALLLTLATVSNVREGEIEAMYSPWRMVVNRMHKLECNGFLYLDRDSVYKITRKGYITIMLFDLLRRFFRHV